MNIRKVHLVTETPIPHTGGMSTHFLLLKEGLEKRGIEVVVTEGTEIYKSKQRYISYLKAIIKNTDLRVQWVEKRIKILHDLIKASPKSDIVHCHDPISIASMIGIDTPVVGTIHGPMVEHAIEHGRNKSAYIEFLKSVENQAFNRANKLIAVDTGQSEIMVDKGVNLNKQVIIHNSVDVNRVKNIGNNNVKISEKLPYFIMARRLVPKNGPVFCINSFLDWVQDKEVRLLVAGDGPQRKEIEKIIKSHSNGHKIKLLGNIKNEEVLPLIKNSIGSLVPSIPVHGVIEATSLTALETLALDIPLIASNIGGLKEIDRGSGLVNLIEPGDKLDIMKALDNVFKGSSTKENARSMHIEKFFGVEQWIDKHIDIYKKALINNF